MEFLSNYSEEDMQAAMALMLLKSSNGVSFDHQNFIARVMDLKMQTTIPTPPQTPELPLETSTPLHKYSNKVRAATVGNEDLSSSMATNKKARSSDSPNSSRKDRKQKQPTKKPKFYSKLDE